MHLMKIKNKILSLLLFILLPVTAGATPWYEQAWSAILSANSQLNCTTPSTSASIRSNTAILNLNSSTWTPTSFSFKESRLMYLKLQSKIITSSKFYTVSALNPDPALNITTPSLKFKNGTTYSDFSPIAVAAGESIVIEMKFPATLSNNVKILINGVEKQFIYHTVQGQTKAFIYYNSSVNGNVNFTISTSSNLPSNHEFLVIVGKEASPESVSIEYSNTTNNNPSSWSSFKSEIRTNASSDAPVMMRARSSNPTDTGTVVVYYQGYVGATFISDLIWKGLVEPLREKFASTSKLMYQNIVHNVSFINIVRTLLTMYVMFSAIFFLIGSIQITAQDLLARVIKITIVTTVISEDSWNFFNGYLFEAFVGGTDFLIHNISGYTGGDGGNIFTFIDPIFARVIDVNFWKSILSMAVSFWTGLTFFVILYVFGLLSFLIAFIDVIISYLIAFLAIYVLIAMAPFFIILILFEKTRSMFEAWISTIFGYILQPSLILLFMLIIESIMDTQLTNGFVQSCWGPISSPIEINLDLQESLGIPINFSFPFEYLPQPYFFIGKVEGSLSSLNTVMSFATTAFIVLCLGLIADKLSSFVTDIVAQIGGVLPERQEGRYQSAKESASGLAEKIKSPFKKALSAPARKIASLGSHKNPKQKPTKETDRLRDIQNIRDDKKGPGDNSAS